MSFAPTELSQPTEDTLRIQWDDGLVADIPVARLRERCPCATCREKRQANVTKGPELLPVLDAREAQPTRIAAMKPVGNYAYSIEFNDGHNTGIFTLEFLRELSTPEDAK